MSIDLPLSADIYIGIILFCLGACMGSFVACAADRYAKKESLGGRSHCDSCGARLGALELIPIFSYLCLKGKCRKCGARIPVDCLLAEIAMALAYLAVYLYGGVSVVTAEYLLLVTALMAVALIDSRTLEIPDGLIVFGLVVYLAFLYPHGDWEARIVDGVWGALAYGGGMTLISLVLDFVLKRESLGGGDIKLFAMLGLYTGLVGGLIMLLCSSVTGLATAAAGRKGGKGAEIPFGPAIAAGAIVALLLGQLITDMYMSLLIK